MQRTTVDGLEYCSSLEVLHPFGILIEPADATITNSDGGQEARAAASPDAQVALAPKGYVLCGVLSSLGVLWPWLERLNTTPIPIIVDTSRQQDRAAQNDLREGEQ